MQERSNPSREYVAQWNQFRQSLKELTVIANENISFHKKCIFNQKIPPYEKEIMSSLEFLTEDMRTTVDLFLAFEEQASKFITSALFNDTQKQKRIFIQSLFHLMSILFEKYMCAFVYADTIIDKKYYAGMAYYNCELIYYFTKKFPNYWANQDHQQVNVNLILGANLFYISADCDPHMIAIKDNFKKYQNPDEIIVSCKSAIVKAKKKQNILQEIALHSEILSAYAEKFNYCISELKLNFEKAIILIQTFFLNFLSKITESNSLILMHPQRNESAEKTYFFEVIKNNIVTLITITEDLLVLMEADKLLSRLDLRSLMLDYANKCFQAAIEASFNFKIKIINSNILKDKLTHIQKQLNSDQSQADLQLAEMQDQQTIDHALKQLHAFSPRKKLGKKTKKNHKKLKKIPEKQPRINSKENISQELAQEIAISANKVEREYCGPHFEDFDLDNHYFLLAHAEINNDKQQQVFMFSEIAAYFRWKADNTKNCNWQELQPLLKNAFNNLQFANKIIENMLAHKKINFFELTKKVKNQLFETQNLLNQLYQRQIEIRDQYVEERNRIKGYMINHYGEKSWNKGLPKDNLSSKAKELLVIEDSIREISFFKEKTTEMINQEHYQESVASSNITALIPSITNNSLFKPKRLRSASCESVMPDNFTQNPSYKR